MKLVLVTGMSGAGKSVALKTLEDCGFEAIDNIPLAYLPDIATSGARAGNLAVAIDIRSRDFSADALSKQVSILRKNKHIKLKLLFLDCDDEVLRRRYTETRRRHPLAEDRTVMDGIHHERELVGSLRDEADEVIDTTETDAATLRNSITAHFADGERALSLVVTSFSFKRGVPREADMVFDVRFLKNPHYDETLRPLTGKDAKVGAYIKTDAGFSDFIARLEAFILPLLPRYKEEGKHYLTLAIGCTGGQHRSVFVAETLARAIEKGGYAVTVRHRDMEG